MVRNRIKALLAEAEITATTLVEKMPAGVDKVAMSYITNGRVLPTTRELGNDVRRFQLHPGRHLRAARDRSSFGQAAGGAGSAIGRMPKGQRKPTKSKMTAWPTW